MHFFHMNKSIDFKHQKIPKFQHPEKWILKFGQKGKNLFRDWYYEINSNQDYRLCQVTAGIGKSGKPSISFTSS